MEGTSTGTVGLDEKQVARLTEAFDTATRSLNETRQRMDAKQEEIGKVVGRLEALEKKNSDGGTELDALKKRLNELAASVQTLAEQNTNLVESTRKQMLRLAQSEAAPERAYQHRDGRGSVFAARRQAVELGYFFMATMKPDNHSKQYARRWLRENGKDLRFLPNIPKSFIEELGADWKQVVERCVKQGFEYAAQDLGGGTVPGSVLTFPQFADTFIRNVELHGAFRRNALNFPMGAETVFIPRRTGGVQVYWIGEATAGTETEPSWDLLRMIAKKAMSLHQYSSELGEDENAAIALADLLMFEFSLAWAQEEDRIGFLGTGAGGASPGYAGFWGVLGLDSQAYAAEASEDKNKCLQYTAGTGLDRTDEVTLKGLRTMIGICHSWARANAKWYAHRTVMQDLYGIETTGGGPITSSDASGRTRLVGYGTEEVEVMPASPGTAQAKAFAFGDLRKGWTLGDRRQPEVETSEHYAFNTDQITVRFSSRVAFLPTSPTAMVVYILAA